MGAVAAAPTAWPPVGNRRDGLVDRAARTWTTRSWRELSTSRPRVVHGSRRGHPRRPNPPSTELSPGVGEVCAHGDAPRPINHRRVVTAAVRNRWRYPVRTRGETRG